MLKLAFTQLLSLYKKPEDALHLSTEVWQSLLLVMRHHQLLPRFQYLFDNAGIIQQLPEYAQHHLTNAKILSEKQYQQVFFEAEKLSSSFAICSHQKVFLKGAAYTLSGLNVGQGRIYSDIDLLVEQCHINDIEKGLSVSGWFPQPIDDYDDAYYRNWSHEVPPIQHATRGTVLDLHHNLVPIISGRSPDISHFFNHVVKTKDGYSVLTPAAMVLHSMIHLFFNEEFNNGFRDLLDLDLLIAENASDKFWHELTELTQQTEFNDVLALAIRYLTKILETPIPETMQKKFKLKNGLKTKLADFIFMRVLLPAHPLMPVSGQEVAALLAFFRGHYLKMPLHILLYHSIRKGFRSSVEYLFGKAFFAKDDKEHKF